MKQPHVYTGYTASMPAPPGRITPQWVKFPCTMCGTDTWIGPTQVAHKAQHGGDVVCPTCVAKGGGQSENIQNLGDRQGQPFQPGASGSDLFVALDLDHQPDIAVGRTLDDGRVLYVNLLFCGEARLCLGDRYGVDQAWYYETVDQALAAYVQWQPDVEPTGWNRHIPSHRRREHGDPTKECVRP